MKTTLYVKELDDGNEEIVDIVDYDENPIITINDIYKNNNNRPF